jgi:neutral ceramidase
MSEQAITASSAPSPDSGRLLIGCGSHDITGPAAERGMMGYASPFQKTGGVHMRLQSRAFVIESEASNERLAFVSADLCMISEAIKREVVARLRRTEGDRFTTGNVMISATHTHACPGGYSHHTLYNLSTLGFDHQNFEAIAGGITQSILRAIANWRPGCVKIAAGELSDITKNRSLPAYERNPEAERGLFSSPTDDSMTVLRFEGEDGRELGTINWFAVHGTSLDNRNRLISGDNKGYASYLFERLKTRQDAPAFVAAFAQSNEGDVSPNVYGGPDGRGPDQFISTERSGSRQFESALALYEKAVEEPPPVMLRVRHAFVDMSRVEIGPERSGSIEGARTTPAQIGASMLAGTEDGRGVGWEGLSRNAVLEWLQRLATLLPLIVAVRPWRLEALAAWMRLLFPRQIVLRDAKIKVIPTGRFRPPWTPGVLPFQLAQIGSLAVAAVPFELTTMAGRRLKRDLSDSLAAAGVTHVAIAGLANAYAGYVTTREEYAAQHYEGASTHFGPWTLAAVQQTFDALSRALLSGEEPDSATEPPPVEKLLDYQTAVLTDAAPPGRSLGALRKDAEPVYSRGQRVVVSCWAGHPKNDLRLEGSFLSVERREQDGWQEVAGDRDPETRYHWRRWLVPFLPFSTATAEWRIREDAEPGTYRIRIHGAGKRLFGSIRSYEGRSREFEVR